MGNRKIIPEIIFLSTGYRGGALKFMEQHISFLIKKKLNITLVDENPSKNFPYFHHNKIKIIKLSLFNKVSNSKKQLKLLLNNKKKKIIFFTNFVIYVRYFFFFRSLCKNNIKFFLTIHSGVLNFTIKRYFAAFVFSFIAKNINYLFFGSQSAKNWWKSNFSWFSNKKYKVIYNGIEIPKKKILLKKNILNVSFVGRLEKENNPKLFLQLAKESFLKNSKFNFHVFGNGSLLNSLKKEYSLYAKFYNWKKLNEIYRVTDLLVITSYVNNFPYAALEAKSYGVPVLSCSKGDISKIIESNKDGYLISVANPRILLEYLNKMGDNYYSLVKHSLKTRYKFNVNNSCNKFWNLIL